LGFDNTRNKILSHSYSENQATYNKHRKMVLENISIGRKRMVMRKGEEGATFIIT
jgi:hypothetical protein